MIWIPENLFKELDKIIENLKRIPTRNEVREVMSTSPFESVFGTYRKAINAYKLDRKIEENNTNQYQYDDKKDNLILTLKENLTEKELNAIIQSANGYSQYKPKGIPHNSKEDGHFKFIVTGDSHIGHKEFREDWWDFMVDRGIKENVDFMYHTGDILEGMSGRPGHIYELEYIGFEAQFKKAKELLEKCPFEIRMITGNHDGWLMGKADQGVNVGMRLQESLSNFVYLGHDEADDEIQNVKIKLFHGGSGGAAKTYSYRLQNFVDTIYGGTKPNILLAGHTHKSIFFLKRNVHVFETGTLCTQSRFMRGKSLEAHTGYWIVTVFTNENGVARIIPEWNPFY